MKPNVWNISDVLNIPMTSLGTKSNKNGATSDYSSLADSQFLSGSQFWPDNSQSFSQDISGQSRCSQQASQEINDLKVSTNYHSKPFLFGDVKAPNTAGGKAIGILDRFEEEKRKAKENEILMGIRQLHESLENVLRTFIRCIDGSCNLTRSAVAEGIDGFRKPVQDNFSTIKDSITSQTELLMSLQSQTHKAMKDTEAKTILALKDLNSAVVSLQKDLESLKADQSKEQSVLKEILSLLDRVVIAHSSEVHSSSVRKADSTVQTSPGLVAQFCVVSEEKCCYEGMKLCNGAITHPEEKADQTMCFVRARSPEKPNTGSSFQVLGTLPVENQQQVFSYIDTEKSEPSAWQKSLRMHPVPNTITTFLQDPRRNYVVAGPVHVEPGKSLDDTDESRLTTWMDMPKPKKVLKRGQRCQTFRKKKRALILPQRRLNHVMASDSVYEDNQHDVGQENIVPLSTVSACWKATNTTFAGNHPSLQQQSTTGQTNRSECRQQLTPWSWAQSNNSSQLIVEYKKAELEEEEPGCNKISKKKKRGVWQLFDFTIDSD